MTYEDAVDAYVNALTELNASIRGYNELCNRHPDFEGRHRLATVPTETWTSHLDTRYAPAKLKRVREGPLTNIKTAVDGTAGVGLKDKVSESSSRGLLDRLFGESIPDGLDEELRAALDDISEQVDAADRAARRLRKQAVDRYGHRTASEE